MFVDDVALQTVTLAILDTTCPTNIGSFTSMDSKVHIQITLVFCRVWTMCTLEVHVAAILSRLFPVWTFPMVCVFHMVFQIFLPTKCSLTVLTFQIVFFYLW